MKFDVLEGFSDFLAKNVKGRFDWVTALPVYQQHLYNSTFHKSLGLVYNDTMSMQFYY